MPKDRRAKLAAKRQWTATLRARQRFPEVKFVRSHAPEEFVEAVKAATRQVRFDDPFVFKEWETNLFKVVRARGAAAAAAELEAIPADDVHHKNVRRAYWRENLAHHLFELIPKGTLLRYLPMTDVNVATRGRAVEVEFRSLLREPGPFGTVYYSRNLPTVVLDGQKLVVAFSKHSIDRTCERVAWRWPSYDACGEVFSFFHRCLEFELCEVHPGHLAFTFWRECVRGPYVKYMNAAMILGESFVWGEHYVYRVGYCPAVVEGGFIKAKSMLFPGHRGTPEYGLLLNKPMPHEERRRMLDLAEDLTAARLREKEYIYMLKWYHDQGVPQIRRGKVAYAKW
jgi:hypothetical protein